MPEPQTVETPGQPGHGGELWVSATELARLKSVSVQAISKRMDRLEGERRITTRRQAGRRQVRLAEWDLATSETTDLSRVAGRATRAAAAGIPIDDLAKPGSAYTEELTRKARYDADLKKIEIDRLRGDLRTKDDIIESMRILGEAMVRDIDQLPSRAEDVHAASAKGGVIGTRDALRRAARDLRERLERTLATVDYRAPSQADAA